MKSILVLRSAALGDFIIATPALKEVRYHYQGRQIILLTTQSFDKVQRTKVADYVGDSNSMPWVSLAMPQLIDELLILSDKIGLKSLYFLRQSLSQSNIEAAIIMADPCAPWAGRIKKMLLLKLLLGNIPILGWRGRGSLKGNLSKLKRDGLLRHHVHGPLQFLSEIRPRQEYCDEDLSFDLRPEDAEIHWANSWISDRQLQAVRLVVVAPGSIQPHKRWPEASFRGLIEMLLAKYGDISIVIVGTPKDHEIGESLAQSEPSRIFNLAGISDIAQSAALMARSTLVVGNDGGAMHLADAMGAKVISLIPGIEYPDSIEPWHNKDLAIRWPVECSPCYSFMSCPQGHNKCMTSIPVSLVFEKCASVL